MYSSFFKNMVHFAYNMKNRLQGLCNVQCLYYGQNTLHTQDEKHTTGIV